MTGRGPAELNNVDPVACALAKTTELKKLKALRDKAEAARNYARTARLGLTIQNHAAELRLRVERQAGQLLAGLIARGGDQKSKAYDGRLKLADLGIDRNHSMLWRREAAVPDDVFEQYIKAMHDHGKEITTRGLLRAEQSLARSDRVRHSTKPAAVQGNHVSRLHGGRKLRLDRGGNDENAKAPRQKRYSPGESEALRRELFDELKNHGKLLAKILKPICVEQKAAIKTVERRMVSRLLAESEELIARLEEASFGEAVRHY
jgi:hypothetical protein